MGHMLDTINPTAAARLANGAPLPQVGDTVLFFPRPGEIRAGKPSVPALVLKSDEDNRLLDILVFNDADDYQSLQRVPQHMGDDRGWEARPAADLVPRARFEAFQAEMAEVLFGDQPRPESGSMLEAMGAIFQRLDALEKALAGGRKRK